MGLCWAPTAPLTPDLPVTHLPSQPMPVQSSSPQWGLPCSSLHQALMCQSLLSSTRWQWFPCLPRGPPSTWSQKFPGSCPSGSMHVTVPGLSRKHATCLLHPRPICLPTSPSQQHRGTTGRDEMSPTCGYPSGPGAAAGCSKNTGLRSPGTQRLWWLRGS